MKILSKIRGVFTIFQFVITVFITVVFMYLFRKNTHPIRHVWGQIQTFLMSFTIKNVSKPDEKATLLVMNHQSLVDIVALEASYPKDLCWIAKEELKKIPLFGHVIRAPRMIAIDRKDKRSIIKIIKEGKERLEEGRVLAIFPEGTRNESTQLLPFQSGAKVLAEKLNLIVQPLVITGARYVFDSKRLEAHGGGEVQRIYLDPIDPKQDPNWYEKLQQTMQERLDSELANASCHR